MIKNITIINGCVYRNIKRPAVSTFVVTCFCLFFFMMSGMVRAELVDRVVAIVNDDVILLSELNQIMAPISANLDNQGFSQSRKNEILKQQRGLALEQLIYDKLTDQQVKRHNIKIEEGEVDATIQRILKVNRMSDEDLRRNLELDGISYEAYREQVKNQLLRRRLVNREVKSKIVVTDEDIKAYYDAHLSDYGGHTKYELRHILIKKTDDDGSPIEDQARRKIELIYDRLLKGESFEELAAKYSQMPSAAHEGYLGVYDLNILSGQMKQALSGLEAKQFSKVVDTEQGYQIFYVEKIIQDGGKGIDAVRAEIQDKLFADVVDKKFDEWIKNLRKHSHIQILE